jgi:hypothetical protein
VLGLDFGIEFELGLGFGVEFGLVIVLRVCFGVGFVLVFGIERDVVEILIGFLEKYFGIYCCFGI